jgi:cell division protein FtsB
MARYIGLVVLVFSLWATQVIAQSDTAVRSELTNLRSRVSRLEGEIRRLSGGSRPQFGKE